MIVHVSMGPKLPRSRSWIRQALLSMTSVAAAAAMSVGCSSTPATSSGGGGSTGSGGGAVTGAGGGSVTGTGGGGGGDTGTAGVTGTAGTTGGTGGVTGTAGTTGVAGTTGTAGTTGGGGAGGPGGAGPVTTSARSVTSFDSGWLFMLGDPAGASTTAFADGGWRSLNVPHDWSIEGPFDQNATTLGNGGYLPTGVGWYRKHFTLPTTMQGQRIFVEFDGVMANSSVYINGTLLGTRPYGYVSFRYEITAQATFGATQNVIAVRADDSAQPASRWYAGAGIYRHVRLIATKPVHIAQWATFVTTPTVTTTSATVHIATSVVNQGTTAQSVNLQATVADPSGAQLAPVSTLSANIAAGATGNFAFDIPVSNPKLWSTTTPNLYQLLTSVIAGGATQDDEVTTFGIRTIKFDPTAGFTLNGAGLKFKGMGMHHEISGLGSAVPMRAWQRRLAQLKAIGVNALRTSHNPYAPEVLDLCDRMGIVVLEEFFDAWTAHKVVADYGGASFNMWGTTDLTDTIKRDRNHPSVVLYSIGNEIRDGLASQMATATNLVSICHTTDSTRPVTQALFQPMDHGYFPGATGAPTSGPTMLSILDIFGANYRIAEVLTAIAITPKHAGLVTEDGSTTTSNWGMVTATPALVGDFYWTSHDYLGEAAGLYPQVGSTTGIMDRMGTMKPIAYSFATVFGATMAMPPTGTTATKIVLTPDHTSLLTDPNDIVYVKAAVTDANGRVVTSAANPVTFSVTGPGTIVAVDSGSVNAESFRGTQRMAYQGLAFALIQATGPGAITVSASTAGLTGATAMVTATAGTFVPCAGTCD